MLKKHHRFCQSLLMGRDVVLVALAFYAAYVCRFSLPHLLPFHSVASLHETLAVGLMLVVIWPLVGYAGGLYVSQRSRSTSQDIFAAFKTTLIALLLLVTLTYFVRDVRYSRAVLILWALFCILAQAGGRCLVHGLLRHLRAQGFNLRHVLLVGDGQLVERVYTTLQTQLGAGLRVVGVLGTSASVPNALLPIGQTAKLPRLGDISALARLCQQHAIDQVIVALSVEQLPQLGSIMATLSRETVDVRLVPDFYPYMTLCGSLDEMCGLPIINLQSSPLLGWDLIGKRLFDVLAASLALLCSAPLLLLTAVAIRCSGPGPILYQQQRTGLDGRRFNMLKFRTMAIDAEKHGAQMAVAGDDRCTPLGRWLRRLSLDELPQLYNVLRGEMSMVGPRPERPCFIETFKQEIPRYALRHKIKAGMTGWAQIHGMRGNTCIAKRIELDLYYIEHWSLLLDIKILLRTLWGGFMSPHAY